MDTLFRAFWGVPEEELILHLESGPEGLTGEEAERRLRVYGLNSLTQRKSHGPVSLLISQFKSPLIIILLAAAILSFFLHDSSEAVIIFVIVLASGFLGFWQEQGATGAVAKLQEIVRVKARAERDGKEQELALERIVPGDLVILGAGDVIPGDCRILSSTDLFVDEASITGETFPVEKSPSKLAADTLMTDRVNSLWMGTHVVSGIARALVVRTGKETEFGKVSEHLRDTRKETEFERGIRRFGYLLMEVTLILVVAVFAVNVFLHRPVLESFLFSLALAVGLTPQLLPAIISINLAHGAKQMADSKVIVKRLASIENFGSMNVICSDKTGTLTEGKIRLHSAIDAEGNPSEEVMLAAYLNASFEMGFSNPIDSALRNSKRYDLAGYVKLNEIPYDFVRKRLSILVSYVGKNIMVTKGALRNILDVCSQSLSRDGTIVGIDTVRNTIERRFEELGRVGLRTLGVARKDLGTSVHMDPGDESGMTFLGFIVLQDPPKASAPEAVSGLKDLGVRLKIVTGDNALVAAAVGESIGLHKAKVLTGSDLQRLSASALVKKVERTDIFAEIEPFQKERIILALKSAGNVVGYIGDGINDVSAIHAADVGISVSDAVDVAKEAADIVLLEKDLGVLVKGVREGRKTFSNTLKYIFMATSANFGNMFSMAGASLLLPFLPLLPKQILLTNLLTDFPEMAIASDRVDSQMIAVPRRWNIKFITAFMLTFGITSSLFDFLMFALLLLIFRSSPEKFRTAWFLESVISASLAVLVIRSRGPFFRSKPGKTLVVATIIIVAVTLLLPYSPFAGIIGFVALPASYLFAIGGLIAAYVATVEIVKHFFYRKVSL